MKKRMEMVSRWLTEDRTVRTAAEVLTVALLAAGVWNMMCLIGAVMMMGVTEAMDEEKGEDRIG